MRLCRPCISAACPFPPPLFFSPSPFMPLIFEREPSQALLSTSGQIPAVSGPSLSAFDADMVSAFLAGMKASSATLALTARAALDLGFAPPPHRATLPRCRLTLGSDCA